MARKRKARSGNQATYEVNNGADTFPDSEDEFYAGKDRILLDEGPAAKRRRKVEQEMQDLQPSDEEVLGEDEELDDEDLHGSDNNSEDLEDQRQDSDAEDDAYWGASKSDYYNADPIETEADALEEEAEARRLQQKHLKRMTDADFGFDELEWKDDEQAQQKKGMVVEKLPPIQIPDSATDEERLHILRTRYPEFEPLAEDLLELNDIYQELKAQSKSPAWIKTKLRAASAYMAAIAMYLAILTSTKDGLALAPADLRDHPIMTSLLRCRQLWNTVDDFDGQKVEVHVKEPTVVEPPVQKSTFPATQLAQNGAKTTGKSKKKRSPSPASSGLDDLDAFAPVPAPFHDDESARNKKAKKSKAIDINDLLSAAITDPAEDDKKFDFGDEAPLTGEEAAEKARKKKSLRFYTSQIAQKSNKRGAKSREAGGDDDIPYKERIKDKQARQARETASQATKQTQDSGLNSGDDDNLAQDMNVDANEYYDNIVSKSSAKKADKRAKAEAYAEAAQLGAQVYEEAQVGPDGKRKITYAIEKNKGLTPKRKKEVRNPRVKKKKRYEQKMKKLGSMRPVYKGGEGKGGYGGELTGIKTNIVKSVKL